MPCKPCEEKRRILGLGPKIKIDMKKLVNDTSAKSMEVNGEEIVGKDDNVSALAISGKLDFNKLVEDRRKALLEGKTIKK